MYGDCFSRFVFAPVELVLFIQPTTHAVEHLMKTFDRWFVLPKNDLRCFHVLEGIRFKIALPFEIFDMTQATESLCPPKACNSGFEYVIIQS